MPRQLLPQGEEGAIEFRGLVWTASPHIAALFWQARDGHGASANFACAWSLIPSEPVRLLLSLPKGRSGRVEGLVR